MKITSIRLYQPRIDNKRKYEKMKKKGLKIFCAVTFDDQLLIKDIRLVEGQKGLFLSFPSTFNKAKGYIDLVHPLTKDFRLMVTDAIIKEYEAQQNKGN